MNTPRCSSRSRTKTANQGLERLPRVRLPRTKDFLWLYSPELDGIEESDWARERAVANLKFSEWFKPFSVDSTGAPHPFNLD
jgi:hypothetical protein